MYPFALYPHILHTSAFQLGSLLMSLPTIPVLQAKHSLTLSTGIYLFQWIEQKKTAFVSTSFMEQNWKKFIVPSMYIVLDNSWYQLPARVDICQTVRKTLSRSVSSCSNAWMNGRDFPGDTYEACALLQFLLLFIHSKLKRKQFWLPRPNQFYLVLILQITLLLTLRSLLYPINQFLQAFLFISSSSVTIPSDFLYAVKYLCIYLKLSLWIERSMKSVQLTVCFKQHGFVHH